MTETIRVVLFGAAADRAGTREERVQVESGSTVESVWDALVEKHPRVGEMRKTLAFAVNNEYASMTQSVSDGDEVAMLPPVSGG